MDPKDVHPAEATKAPSSLYHGHTYYFCTMRFAGMEALRSPGGRALDLGCGAGRNAVPLAASGWAVLGLDLSWPMLVAAFGPPQGTARPSRRYRQWSAWTEP